MIELNRDNIRLYAARYYENPSCLGESEFMQDFSMAKRINTAIVKGNDVRRLINMIITFCNVFEPIAACRILFFYSDQQTKLKSLLTVLERFPPMLEYDYPFDNDTEWLEMLKEELK